jgi:hypothetical protein
MGCFVGIFAIAFPRVALVLVWLFGPPNYVSSSFPGVLWPILGFVFLPTTTLAFAFASHSLAHHGQLTSFGWLVTILGLLFDIGLIGGGGRAARSRDDD